jgi:hypothetical protein
VRVGSTGCKCDEHHVEARGAQRFGRVRNGVDRRHLVTGARQQSGQDRTRHGVAVHHQDAQRRMCGFDADGRD